MSKLEIIFPSGHLGASNDEPSGVTMLRVIAVAFGGEQDWTSKYGCDFENEVFLMKRFCWCEQEGECPWCTGCGVYADAGACVACREARPHSADCYQTALQARLSEYEVVNAEPQGASRDAWKAWYDRKRAFEDALYNTLCAQHGVDRQRGAAVHCTCGADADRLADQSVRGCDYSMGRGIFARFAPWTLGKDSRYYDPPNFWYKPANLRVTWYKYIGRDTVSNGVQAPADMLARIFATHPTGMNVEAAMAELEESTAQTRQAWRDMLESVARR